MPATTYAHVPPPGVYRLPDSFVVGRRRDTWRYISDGETLYEQCSCCGPWSEDNPGTPIDPREILAPYQGPLERVGDA